MTLFEMVVVIAIIGIIASLAIPALQNVGDSGNDTVDRKNANELANMSTALASIGVAHVIPDSLGGVEATARLFRDGIVVPDGAYAGQEFQLSGLNEESIAGAARYLEIVYDLRELRLVMKEG